MFECLIHTNSVVDVKRIKWLVPSMLLPIVGDFAITHPILPDQRTPLQGDISSYTNHQTSHSSPDSYSLSTDYHGNQPDSLHQYVNWHENLQNIRSGITPHGIEIHLRLRQLAHPQLRVHNILLVPYGLGQKRSQRSNDAGAAVT